ncbi:MAG: fibro-slime domain-containing protein [Fibrobacterota bacterium]
MNRHLANSIRTAKIPVVALLVSLFAANTSAAKVLRFLSPFGNTNIWVCGGAFGFAPGSDPNTLMKLAPDNWMQLVLPAGAAIDKYTFVVMPDWQYQQNTPDLTAILTAGDTAWILPEPSPNGPLKAFGTRPATKTVMLWNPWEVPAPRRTPYIQVEGRAWGQMSPVVRLPGWYTVDITGYNSMSLLFADSAKSAYFGMAGVTATVGSPMILDSIASRSDTIWVRARPEPVGAPLAAAKRPPPKVAMVFNPWRGQKPLVQPRLTLGSLGPVSMTSSLEYCGWYTFEFYERAGGAVLANSRSGQKVGAAGFGDPTTFDIATLLASQDTAWIMTDSVTGKPTVNKGWAGQKGLCEVVLLATTVHDFPNGTAANRQFGAGSGCGQGNWGVVQGMVESTLGADRKPVRSNYEKGFNGIVNEWGGKDYGYRCAYDTSAGSEIGDSGITTEWFRDVPGRNASACRDIPLQLDSVNGTYSYQSKFFFPIDDFSRLADGSPNPYFDQIRGEDQKLHNYAFCLESHGDFEYKKGQSYDFTGDDDVWFFVNNHLVVDLGGIHPASSRNVLLDTIGRVITKRSVNGSDVYDTTWNADRLIEGRTYPWDFFFCERNPAGSSMKMTTSMNLRTDGNFQVKTTANGPGSTKFDIYASATKGQGCQAVSSVVHSSGRFVLAGGQFSSARQLSSGTWYGGIVVDSAGGTATLDSASISDLAPGQYVLRIVSSYDSTAAKEFPFTVPFTAGPRFVAKPAYTGLVGSSFSVSVAAYNKLGPDSAWVKFVAQAPTGLKFYRDSALKSEIVVGDTLRTGTNTLPRRFWVVGVVAGTYTLAIGSTNSDTADTYPLVVFQDRGLRFVDSTGAPLSSIPPIALDIGASKQVFVQAFAGGIACVACIGPVRLEGTPGLVFSATQNGAAITSAPLSGAIASFWVRADAPVRSGSLTTILASDTSARAVWSPVSTNGYRLRFVDATGNVADTIAPVDRRVLTGQTISVQVWGSSSLCSNCSGVLRLSSSAPGLVFRDMAGVSTDSVSIVSGTARFVAWGAAPTIDAKANLVAPSLWATNIATTITFRVKAPDSLFVYDTDGDGRADSVGVQLGEPWKAGNTLSLSWPDASGLVALQPLAPASFDGDSGVLYLRLAAPLAVDRTSSVNAAAAFSWDGTVPLAIPVVDRIAPVPVSATISWGTEGRYDTLRVKLSELITRGYGLAPVEILRGSIWSPTYEVISGVSISDDELFLLFDFTFPANTPVPGDRIRLSFGGATDLFGNKPGSDPKSVIVTGPQRPPRQGWYQDTDGDGRVDRAVFRFASAVRTESLRFDMELPGAGARTSQPGQILLSDSTLVAVDLAEPFPFGATSFPAGNWAGIAGGSKVAMRDSIAPTIDTAFVRLTETYDGSDTLFVVSSEPLVGNAAANWFQALSAGSVQILSGRFVFSRNDTIAILLPADGIGGVRAGDSLRYVASGEVSDVLGNSPISTMHWRKVGGGIRPPLIRILAPIGRFDRPSATLDAIGKGITVVATSASGWSSWSPATGYQGATEYDSTNSSGAGLELNAPAHLTFVVYDRLGTHVASSDLDITETALGNLQKDRLGRTKVRFLWDGSTSAHKPAASGIYLYRMIVRSTSSDRSTRIYNHVWTIGLKRP